MKNKIWYLFALLSLILCISSCTIKKRLYEPGYHVEWNTSSIKTKSTVNANSSDIAITKSTENSTEIPKLTQNEANNVYSSVEKPNSLVIVGYENKSFSMSSIKIDEEISENIFLNESFIRENRASLFKEKNKNIISKTIKAINEDEDDKSIHWASIVGFICGIASIFAFPLAIPGIIFSIIGLVKTSGNPDVYKGKAFAIVGIITSGLMLLFVGFLLGLILVLF